MTDQGYCAVLWSHSPSPCSRFLLSADSLIGTFHNLRSGQNVAGGPGPRAQLPGRFAVDLSSVNCDLTGQPNTMDLPCSDRSRLYPFGTDSGISLVPSDPKTHSRRDNKPFPLSITLVSPFATKYRRALRYFFRAAHF
jgi:hypothetical protein